MANAHSIKIISMKTLDKYEQFTNVVRNIRFAVVATDENGNSAEVEHDCVLDPKTIVDFVPYDKLTERMAKQWILEAFNPLSIKALENDADNKLAGSVAPSIQEVALPWAQPIEG